MIARILAPSALAALVLVGTASSGLASTAFLSPDELHPGQKATVLTVFQGSRIESFDAEIVGVLHNGRAEGDMILARATSERVIQSGVAQGMSGSPVYVDGKLIGALSSSWPFSREPIFGVTPIGEMLEVLKHPRQEAAGRTAGPSGADPPGMSAGIRFGEFHWGEDLSPGADGLSPGSSADPAALPGELTPLAVPVSCSGLSPKAFEAAARLLAPLRLAVVPGGVARSSSPTASRLEPGAAIAVDLLRGDLQFSAIGTVTYVEGDRMLAFGHPFFQSGDVRLPLATAEIATIVASTAVSFKLGLRGQTIGVLDQDRRPAVAGTLGKGPPMLPVSVTVRGTTTRPQAFRYESVEDKALAPTLIGLAAYNSVLESGGSGSNQTIRWTMRLYRKGRKPLELTDVLASDNPTLDVAGGVTAPLRFLLGNPYGPIVLDSVAVLVDVTPGRALWTLRNAVVVDAFAHPGGTLRVRCELERWRGGREWREISLKVPEEAPEGRYALWLGGATEFQRYEALRLPGRYRPSSLDDAWARLASNRPADALYVALLAKAPEVTTDGRDYPELPASALPLLASPRASGDQGRRGDLAKLDERKYPFDGNVRGELLLPVDVDASAP